MACRAATSRASGPLVGAVGPPGYTRSGSIQREPSHDLVSGLLDTPGRDRSRGSRAMTSMFDRYQRIARLYDFLIRRSNVVGIAACPRSSSRDCQAESRCRCRHGTQHSIRSAGCARCWHRPSPAMLAQARRRARALGPGLNSTRWMSPALASRINPSMRRGARSCSAFFPTIYRCPPSAKSSEVLKPGGVLRLLEYVRPKGRLRAAMARLWEPWMAWVYGAGFDRRTEEHVVESGLEILESRFVVEDLIKLISAHRHGPG